VEGKEGWGRKNIRRGKETAEERRSKYIEMFRTADGNRAVPEKRRICGSAPFPVKYRQLGKKM
jgi:hypothetical protein